MVTIVKTKRFIKPENLPFQMEEHIYVKFINKFISLYKRLTLTFLNLLTKILQRHVGCLHEDILDVIPENPV